MARTGYTLPVFAVAAAKAALIHLQKMTQSPSSVTLDLLNENADILIEQVAIINSVTALAITISDPGDNLDLTRNTPVWSWVKLSPRQVQNQADETNASALGFPSQLVAQERPTTP